MSAFAGAITQGAAYAGPLLVAVAVVQVAIRRLGGGPVTRAVAAAACVIAVLVPIAGIPLAGYVHVVIGNLSVPTLALLLLAAVGPVGRRPAIIDRRNVAAVVGIGAVLAVVLYPAAFGFVALEPYRWGYAPTVLAVVLLAIVAGAWVTGFRTAAWVLTCAVLAYQAQIFGSPNLWDYVTDPYLPIAGLMLAVVWAVRPRVREPASRG